MEEKNETFRYTYSASQQEEIKRIREKYAPSTQAEDKMEQLRKLDAGVTKRGSVVSLVIGIVSALVMGVGMCCVMVWGDALFAPGVAIGLVGILGVIAAYPLYKRITKKRREKLSPEILRLADELMQ